MVSYLRILVVIRFDHLMSYEIENTEEKNVNFAQPSNDVQMAAND